MSGRGVSDGLARWPRGSWEGNTPETAASPPPSERVLSSITWRERERSTLGSIQTRHTFKTALFTARPPPGKQSVLGFGFTNKHNSKINISRNNHGGDVAFPGDSDIRSNHREL